ncbi:MAG: NAD-dependent epimerase/dehydratase family protein [Acidobacteria bacterium]|nr:NAD-dependent epimerase/dehydratase family protein [Acidobacteriota bacterium]
MSIARGETARTACITGGAGFIGSHLVDAFLAGGWRVLVIDDLSSGRRENLPPGAELAVLDIRSPAAAERVAHGRIDLLVHHAAQMDVRRSVADPVFDAEINVLGGLNLLEAARRGGVGQVIFASTGGAIYGEQDAFPAGEDHPARPVSPYGVSKLALERYLYFYHAAYGMAVTCLRYANVYGERQSSHGEAGVVAIFLDRLLAGRAPTINGDGLQTRDYVHVSDVVRANLAAAGRPGYHVYNVGTGIETTVIDLYRALARAAGSALAPVHGPAKPGEQQRSVVDGRLIRRELGVPEPLALADGLARTAAWFRGRGGTGDAPAQAAAAPAAGPASVTAAAPAARS